MRAQGSGTRPGTRLLHLSGSITALASPFSTAGELDLDAWRRLLQLQLDGGTQGIVVAGSTGEAAALLDVEFDALLRTAVGAVAGFTGGWADLVLMRIVDVLLAFPGLLLAIALAGALGPGTTNVVLTSGTYTRTVSINPQGRAVVQ